MSFIFAVFTIALLYQAFRLMFGGFKAAKELGGRQYMDEGKRYVTKTIHPEIALILIFFGNFKKRLLFLFRFCFFESRNVQSAFS